MREALEFAAGVQDFLSHKAEKPLKAAPARPRIVALGGGNGLSTLLRGLRPLYFAAGFLSATLRGLPVRDRLRHGHLMAAAALTDPGDLGAPPTRDHADRLAALDDDAWGTLRLGPGWTQPADRAQEEVPTP